MQLYFTLLIVLLIATLFTAGIFIRKRIISKEFENIKVNCYAVNTHEQFISAYKKMRNFAVKYRNNQKDLVELQEIIHVKRTDLEKKYRVIKEFSLPFGEYTVTNHPSNPVGTTDYVYIEGVFGEPFETFTKAYNRNKGNDIVIVYCVCGKPLVGTFKQLETIIKQSTMKIVK